YGGGYPIWKKFMFSWFVGPAQSVYLVRGNSHDPSTVERVETLLGGRKVDVIFIDGDHSYAGIRQDFLEYRRLVRQGGIVAFHDIVHNRFDPDIDVARFWDELKVCFKYEEIIDSPDQGNFGIGIVYAPADWQKIGAPS